MKTDGFINSVERLSKWSGEWIAWLIPIDAFAVAYDVIARYGLGRGTDWGYDVGWILYGVTFMIGGSYTWIEKSHVRVDIIYERFSPKTKALLDIFFAIVFILPLCVFLTGYGIEYAARSWEIWERSSYTPWRPFIFPFKTIIPISFIMFGLVVICTCIKNLRILCKQEESR